TQLEVKPVQVLEWFVMRWQAELTFAHARAHLGMETQRQWNDRAIARMTPALLGLYAVITVLADRQLTQHACPVGQTAWYTKMQPTFSDTLALVRRYL